MSLSSSTPGSLPWVSVIIPVYNRPKLATEAVRSVLMQSYPQLECILVDDGSTEAPEEACRLFAADPRFRYLPIVHIGMPGAVRNRGVEAARYGLLAFLDSDDLWLPRKLELQVKLLQAGGKGLFQAEDGGFLQGQPALRPGAAAPLVHSREVWLRGDKIISQKRQRFERRGNVFAEALKKCMIGPSTVLMRRDVYEQLGGFREDLEIAEDYELWLRLTALYQVEFVEEPLIVKRAGHGQQLSEKYGHIELFRLKGLEDLVRRRWFAEQAPSLESIQAGRELQRMASAELADKCSIYAAGCRKRGREQEAQVYEAKAAEYSS